MTRGGVEGSIQNCGQVNIHFAHAKKSYIFVEKHSCRRTIVTLPDRIRNGDHSIYIMAVSISYSSLVVYLNPSWLVWAEIKGLPYCACSSAKIVKPDN